MFTGSYIYAFFFLYISFLLLYPVFRYYVGVRGFLALTVVILSGWLWILVLCFEEIVFLHQSFFLEFAAGQYELAAIEIILSFCISTVSYLFLVLVVAIGLATNIYSLNYFKNEADESNFLFWLNSFIAGMSLLLLSNNSFTLFLGWELIGLTSFFLINFWHTRRATLKSSFKAFSFNLISDIALLVSLVSFYLHFGTTDLSLIVALSEVLTLQYQFYLYLGASFMLLCASIKSVQLVGHLWLPDSMEAPVPASALIHSATLVSAGVYLLVKFFNLFLIAGLLNSILILGSLTCAYGGVVAAAQTDMKKLLAYSTMSHCGFLYITIYFGFFFITILYLFLHGVFKAATFYCVGSFVRVYRSQDIRSMGIGFLIMPLETTLLIFCALNLGGLPFTVGYLYKVFFFKALLMSQGLVAVFGFIIIGLLTSLVYVFRIIYYSSFDYLKGPQLYIVRNLRTTQFSITVLGAFYTPVVIYAVWILFLISFGVYSLTFFILVETFTEISNQSLYILSFVKLGGYYTQLYMPYILLFYFLYTLVGCYLNVIETRFKFTKLQGFYTWGYLIILLFVINILG